MISTYVKAVWLGFSQAGGAANLRIDEPLGGTPVELTRPQLRTMVRAYD